MIEQRGGSPAVAYAVQGLIWPPVSHTTLPVLCRAGAALSTLPAGCTAAATLDEMLAFAAEVTTKVIPAFRQLVERQRGVADQAAPRLVRLSILDAVGDKSLSRWLEGD